MAGKKARPERGVRWGQGYIQERPQADGSVRFQARWPEALANGRTRYRCRTFDDSDEAEDLLRQISRDRRDGRTTEMTPQTVEELIRQWLERGRRRWSDSSYGNYARVADRHLIPAFGRIEGKRLTAHRIQQWIDGLSDAGFKPGTVRLWLNLLRLALAEATRLGLLPVNPASMVLLPSDRRPPTKTWTPTEIRAVMQEVANDPLWTAVYTVALTTGIRPGELRALKWSDIDFDLGLLTVQRTVTRNAQRVQVLGTETKTGRIRMVALTTGSMASLRAWRREQNVHRLAGATWIDQDLVFASKSGRLLGDNTWRHHHELIIERASVTPITLHGLRHTNATLDLVANPKIVSDRLGHSTVAFTLNRYSHVSMDQQRDAAEALERRVFDSPTPTQQARNTTTSS